MYSPVIIQDNVRVGSGTIIVPDVTTGFDSIS